MSETPEKNAPKKPAAPPEYKAPETPAGYAPVASVMFVRPTPVPGKGLPDGLRTTKPGMQDYWLVYFHAGIRHIRVDYYKAGKEPRKPATTMIPVEGCKSWEPA